MPQFITLSNGRHQDNSFLLLQKISNYIAKGILNIMIHREITDEMCGVG
jgi:hypothetical protein